MTKKTSKIVIQTKKIIERNINNSKNKKIHNTIGKIFIILIIIGGILYTNQNFSNTISLLAVTENSKGDIISGSRVELGLEITPGTGQVYSNLNTLEEIDTQISIINSQKIACSLFNLDCSKYDFYYTFNGSAVILKGPSASSAIGIITAKTVNHQKIDANTVITGSLNSGGIIGNVGGVDKKIEVAEINNFTKVLIPTFSIYNQSLNHSIEVIKVINIIEAYNNFNGDKFTQKKEELDFTEYKYLMKELSDMMCERTQNLAKTINISLIEENSTSQMNLKQAINSYNSSINAYNIGNYYSAGSFCYNANINYRLIIETQKELNLTQINNQNNNLKSELNLKYVTLNSNEYKSQIQTINDFYVYMILLDRIEEAKDFLKENNDIIELDIRNQTNNQSNINNTNNVNNSKIIIKLNKENEKKIEELRIKYSYAIERIYTVGLWEKFITHNGNKINFNEKKLDEACLKINYENNIKNQLLAEYNIAIFNKEINEINILAKNPFENKYLCIYKGLELNGKMNTILNSMGIEKESEKNYIDKFLEITQNRLGINSNGNFPLIPYIYFEYSKDLAVQENYGSAMLYSNFALTYADLNLYLEIPEFEKKDFFENLVNGLFNFEKLSLLFIISLLIILGFS